MNRIEPHRPELCRDCAHGHPCTIFGRDMGTNRRGDPWENWTCPHRQARKPTTTKRRNP
jgi:hypothetical protein